MADNLTLRKEVSTLQPAELAALRDAYQQMMAISEADNRGWMYWAEYHGYNRNDCWHHGILGLGTQQTYNLFLPWHRAYLLYFEHTCRDRNGGVALPWWDWTSSASHSAGFPAAFTAPTVGSAANPLLNGPVPSIQGDPARRTTRSPHQPGNLPTAAQVANAVKLGSFVDFTTQLEDIHDQVHVWCGGDMGVVNTAAFDPIFWAHHCMIDRIWYLWQIQNGNASIPQNYLNKPLAPWALTVADVLDIRVLGYEYAASGVSSTGNSASSSSSGSSSSSTGTSSNAGGTSSSGSGTSVADSGTSSDSGTDDGSSDTGTVASTEGDSSSDSSTASDDSSTGDTGSTVASTEGDSGTDSSSDSSAGTDSSDSGTDSSTVASTEGDSSSDAGASDTATDDSSSTSDDSGSVASTEGDSGTSGDSSSDSSTGDSSDSSSDTGASGTQTA